jgi:hypothetical protein
MSSPATHPPSHPVLAAVARAHAELDAVTDQPMWSMTQEEAAQALVEETRLNARLAALTLKTAVQADRTEVGVSRGATSAAVWLANTTHMTQRDAAALTQLGKALEAHAPVEDALTRGDILADQAKVIVEAVRRAARRRRDGDQGSGS